MEYTKPALLLMKKYAAKCRVDWKNLSATVFHPYLERRAEKLNLKKINVDIVRWYWFKIHNSIIGKLLAAGKTTEREGKDCMVSIKNGKVFHKGVFVEKLRGK